MQMLSSPSEEARTEKWLLKMRSTRIITPLFYQVCANKKKNKTQDFSISKLNLESRLFKASLPVESLFFLMTSLKSKISQLSLFFFCASHASYVFYCPLLREMIPMVLLLSVFLQVYRLIACISLCISNMLICFG